MRGRGWTRGVGPSWDTREGRETLRGLRDANRLECPSPGTPGPFVVGEDFKKLFIRAVSDPVVLPGGEDTDLRPKIFLSLTCPRRSFGRTTYPHRPRSRPKPFGPDRGPKRVTGRWFKYLFWRGLRGRRSVGTSGSSSVSSDSRTLWYYFRDVTTGTDNCKGYPDCPFQETEVPTVSLPPPLLCPQETCGVDSRRGPAGHRYVGDDGSVTRVHPPCPLSSPLGSTRRLACQNNGRTSTIPHTPWL